MSPQPAEHATESFFVAQLAEHAKQSSVAAPATLSSLVEALSYLSQDELALVTRAHAYAEQAHQGQSRRTGHAYITHPTAVAQILSNMRMDPQTIMAALLHDVIEDSEANKQTLGDQFGESVAEIVDGVSKLSKIFSSRDEAQAENFQKMAMAMAKDIRVIMVKLVTDYTTCAPLALYPPPNVAAWQKRPRLLCANSKPAGYSHAKNRIRRPRL